MHAALRKDCECDDVAMTLGSEYVKNYVFCEPSFGSCQCSSNPDNCLQFSCMYPVIHFSQANICNFFAGICVCPECEIKHCIQFQNSNMSATSQLLSSTTFCINILPSLIMWCSCKLLRCEQS